MKSTGIVRRIDDLGRLVIPAEIRETLELGKSDPIEIMTEGESIILRKYEKGCVFCGEIRNTKEFKGKLVCEECLEEMK